MNQLVIKECKLELAMGKVEPVINLLLESTSENEELHAEVILLSNRFQRLKAKQLDGTIKDDEAEIQWTKITKGVIDIVMRCHSNEV